MKVTSSAANRSLQKQRIVFEVFLRSALKRFGDEFRSRLRQFYQFTNPWLRNQLVHTFFAFYFLQKPLGAKDNIEECLTTV